MGRTASVVSFFLITVSFEARWWFQTFFMFIPIWERFQFWLIFFKWVVQPPTRKPCRFHSLGTWGTWLDQPELEWFFQRWPQESRKGSWGYYNTSWSITIHPGCMFPTRVAFQSEKHSKHIQTILLSHSRTCHGVLKIWADDTHSQLKFPWLLRYSDIRRRVASTILHRWPSKPLEGRWFWVDVCCLPTSWRHGSGTSTMHSSLVDDLKMLVFRGFVFIADK